MSKKGSNPAPPHKRNKPPAPVAPPKKRSVFVEVAPCVFCGQGCNPDIKICPCLEDKSGRQ